MKLISQLKLQPNNEQLRQLKATIERANEAAMFSDNYNYPQSQTTIKVPAQD